MISINMYLYFSQEDASTSIAVGTVTIMASFFSSRHIWLSYSVLLFKGQPPVGEGGKGRGLSIAPLHVK
jgi:hypothetical protein